jgi:lipopolysaccharide/colanic/teichoic acid biosynthesis glycosyltransferase
MDEARAADVDAVYLDAAAAPFDAEDGLAERATVTLVPAASEGEDDLVVLAEPEPPAHGSLAARATKRTMDVVGGLVLTVVLLPVALAIAVAIAIDSPGPILYRHRRVGRDGVPFSIVKFRTMVRDGDAVLERALADDPERRREWQLTRKLRDDPRVTRVGRLLRRASLDELPQVLNVIVGTMSLVGPRPVMQDELIYFGHRAPAVLSVRPGLTGLWAVSGRSDIDYDERVELEYRYATGWSILGDIAIVLRTLPAVIRGHGAY